MKKRMMQIIPLLVMCAATLCGGIACSGKGGMPEGEKYEFSSDYPFYAEPDVFMTLDGIFDEEQWQDSVWLSTGNPDAGSRFSVTTTFTMEGLYVGLVGHFDNIVWESRHNYASNTGFYIQIVKEDALQWGSGSSMTNHPMRDVCFDIDAKDSLSLRETQYACGQHMEGELNSGNTDYLSAELFVPWEQMNYTEEELGADGMPDSVKIWAKFVGRGSAWHGFADQRAVNRYYTFNEKGSVIDDSSAYLGNSPVYECASEGWVVDDEHKTAQSTTTNTQTIWFKQDDEGNPAGYTENYIAEVAVKPVEGKSGGHAGIMQLRSQEKFNFYTVNVSGIPNGEVSVRSASEMDGGGWAASYSLQKTVNVRGTYDGDKVTLKVIKRGGYVYYFCNGEYVDFEYAPKLEGKNIVGFYANGPAEFSDWSFEDYTGKEEDLDNILSEYLYFAECVTKGQGVLSVDRVAIPKTDGKVRVTAMPRSGFVLAELTAGDVSIYDTFVSENKEMTYEYTITSDVVFTATFERLPAANMQDMAVSAVDKETDEGLVNVSARLKNANTLLNTTLTTNTTGVFVFSLLAKGSYQVAGKTIESDGEYTLEIRVDGYYPVIKKITVNSVEAGRREEKAELVKAWGVLNLNDKDTAASGVIDDYEEATQSFVIDHTGTVKQYLVDTATNGDYLVNAEITVNGKVGNGNVVGIMLGAGGSNSIILKSCSWETNRLCIEVYNGNGGSTEISVSNFTHTLAERDGGKLVFTVARLNEVIYVADENGELGVYMDRDGLHLLGGRTVASGASKLEALNKSIAEFFIRGAENAVGLVQYSNGSGVYRYKVTQEKGTEKVTEFLGSFGVEVTAGDYTVEVTGDVEIGTNKYAKHSRVFVTVRGKNGEKAQLLKLTGDEDKTLTGVYDKDEDKTTFTFMIDGDYTATIVDYEEGDLLGIASVNGTRPETYGELVYDETQKHYKVENTAETRQYFVNTLTENDFVVKFDAYVEERTPGLIGYYMGSAITRGANARLTLWTTFDSKNSLVLSLRTPTTSMSDVIITGFPWTNEKNYDIKFTYAMREGVLYVFNGNGELGFTLDAENGVTSNFPFVAGKEPQQDTVIAAYEEFLKTGKESMIGMYSRQYLPTAATGKYIFKTETDTSAAAAEKFFAPLSFTVKEMDTDQYTATVTGVLPIGDKFAQNTSITVSVESKNKEKVAKAMKLTFTDGSEGETILGLYDAKRGVTDFTFTIQKDCSVEAGGILLASGNVLGEPMVNGEYPATAGTLLYDNEKGYAVSKNDTTNRYFADTFTESGDYAVDFDIDVEKKMDGQHGYVIGAKIAKGNNTFIRIYTTPGEQKRIVVGIRTGNVDMTPEIIVEGFGWTNQTGGHIRFAFAMKDDVLHVYNSNGELGFTVSAAEGVQVKTENGFTLKSSVSQETVKTKYAEFLQKGPQSIVGIYSEKYGTSAAQDCMYRLKVGFYRGDDMDEDFRIALAMGGDAYLNGQFATVEGVKPQYQGKDAEGNLIWRVDSSTLSGTPTQNTDLTRTTVYYLHGTLFRHGENFALTADIKTAEGIDETGNGGSVGLVLSAGNKRERFEFILDKDGRSGTKLLIRVHRFDDYYSNITLSNLTANVSGESVKLTVMRDNLALYVYIGETCVCRLDPTGCYSSKGTIAYSMQSADQNWIVKNNIAGNIFDAQELMAGIYSSKSGDSDYGTYDITVKADANGAKISDADREPYLIGGTYLDGIGKVVNTEGNAPERQEKDSEGNYVWRVNSETLSGVPGANSNLTTQTVYYLRDTLIRNKADFVVTAKIEEKSKSGNGGSVGLVLTAGTAWDGWAGSSTRDRLEFLLTGAGRNGTELRIRAHRCDDYYGWITVSGFHADVTAESSSLTVARIGNNLYVYVGNTCVCKLDAAGCYAAEGGSVSYTVQNQTWCADVFGRTLNGTQLIAGIYSAKSEESDYGTYDITVKMEQKTDKAPSVSFGS